MSVSEPFDLVRQPWLTVRTAEGAVTEVSLVEVFRSAHSTLGLVGDVPTQVFALTRLLLAILHRAGDGPRDVAQWRRLWNQRTLPADAIEAYLETHRHRFDLGHPTEPFFQVATLRTDGKTSDLGKLIADVPNGQPFFTTRIGVPLALTPAEAARWLVHCQAFDPSGIKSGDPDDPRTKKGKGYPIGVGWSGNLGGVLAGGPTLRETLLLNLVATTVDGDLPPWERPQLGVTEEAEDRAPTGPVDLYTWQSRRIRLFGADGRIDAVLIANGDRRTPQNMHPYEPHTAWRRSEAQEKKLRSPVPVYMPQEHNPERMIWRGLQAMLPEATPASGASHLPPGVLIWLAELTLRRVLPKDYHLSIATIGMNYGSQNSTVAEIIDDTIGLRAVLLDQDSENLIGTVKRAVANSEDAAFAVGRLAENLAVAAGSREPIGHRDRAIGYAYGALDPLFRGWLSGLGPDSSADDALADWHRIASRELRALADEFLRQAAPIAWVGRVDRKGRLITSAHAQRWCDKALREALPHAYVPAGSPS